MKPYVLRSTYFSNSVHLNYDNIIICIWLSTLTNITAQKISIGMKEFAQFTLLSRWNPFKSGISDRTIPAIITAHRIALKLTTVFNDLGKKFIPKVEKRAKYVKIFRLVKTIYRPTNAFYYHRHIFQHMAKILIPRSRIEKL